MIEDNAFNIIISAKCFFYQLKRSISLDEIMCFWTGIPPEEFDTTLKICFFTKQECEPGTRYPTASTCALVINLPRGVEDPDELEKLMVFTLQNTAGFSKI